MIKKIMAALTALAVISCPAGTLLTPEANVSASSEILGETSFESKVYPWQLPQSSPAKQNFGITPDGELHISILHARGADEEAWDLQLRHRNLNFKSGHRYTVSFKAKSKRDGMELVSHIGNIKGDEQYCVLDEDTIHNGPHMGGQWGKATVLTTEWQTFSGEFTADKDIEAAEWVFYYAKGTQYEGNAIDGDEIWFDDMSVQCESCNDCGNPGCGPFSYYPDRRYSGTENNYISVNQLGYYNDLSKIAVLGDNAGEIKLTEDYYEFEVVDAETDKAVYSGKSGSAVKDADSGDTVYKLDFSDFKESGTYYIRVGEWVSLKFRTGNDIYSEKGHNLLTDSVNYFYQNRSGIDIEKEYITSGEDDLAHEGGNKTDTAYVQKEWRRDYTHRDDASDELASSEVTASGGWYESGDHGKYVVNSGIALWTLQNMYENAVLSGKESKFADGSGLISVPETDNGIPDILDEAAYELDWMSEMAVKSDEPEWGEYAGMVYHSLQDHKWTGLALRPWDYEEEWGTVRIIKPPTFAATLNYAACAAQAARLWKPYDTEKAAKYLSEAKNAYEAYEKHYYEVDIYDTLSEAYSNANYSEEINKKSLYAPVGGSRYGDLEVRDEAYWAACEIFVSASEMKDPDAEMYFEKLSAYETEITAFAYADKAFSVGNKIPSIYYERGEGESLTSFTWRNTASAGTFTLALHKDLLTETAAAEIESSLVKAADSYIEAETNQGYGIPYTYERTFNLPNGIYPPPLVETDGYEYASNAMVMNNAIVMAYAYNQTNDKKYLNGVSSSMDYILGTNPLSLSFITGYGSYHTVNPYHRYWAHSLDRTLPQAPDGVLSSGPNSGLQDEYMKTLGFSPEKKLPSQRCYADSVEAWSVNDVSVSFNSPLAWVVSFLQDQESSSELSDVSAIKGDVNCDGKVDVTDISVLALSLVDSIPLDSQSESNADTDNDGKAGLADLARIRQYISKQISSL